MDKTIVLQLVFQHIFKFFLKEARNYLPLSSKIVHSVIRYLENYFAYHYFSSGKADAVDVKVAG